MRDSQNHVAVLIGIDGYRHGIPKLTTAVADADAVGRCLEEDHGYDVIRLLDGAATLEALRELLEVTLPARLDDDSHLLFYFAGHGIAQDGDDGPEGFLVPVDAKPDLRTTLLPMVDVAAVFEELPGHHMLLVFDCCFAGSFRWSSTRSFLPATQTLYRKRYDRFLDFPAAQVLTSAAQDEKALDVIDGLTIGSRDTSGAHSPFATALLNGLRGDADKPGPDGEKDGVITATELYLYVRDVVELAAEDRGTQQTPGMWPLRRHDRGEFLFHNPEMDAPNLQPDPVLDESANPWRGLRAYTEDQEELFFGRTRVVTELRSRIGGSGPPLLAVVGASGSGKSSVVNAGLLPTLGDAFHVVGPLRPGAAPLRMLEQAREELAEAAPEMLRVLVIDQFEEIITMTTDATVRATFLEAIADLTDAHADDLQVVITMRADFEGPIRDSALGSRIEAGRYPIPPMTREELREVIDGPAAKRALYFEAPTLPDRILDDLAAMPGALPLLSFTLSELYRRYIEQDERTDRALRDTDYDAMGGVVGSLQTRASELLNDATEAEQATIRHLMLRLVSDAGGELAKRRVTQREQEWPEDAETQRVREVLDRLVGARLLVTGTLDGADATPYVEPAHDMLVMSLDRIRQWQRELPEPLKLRRELWQAATAWGDDPRKQRLWHDDVRLDQVAAGLKSEDRWMNALEYAFVDGSVRHREARRQRFSILAMVVFGILAGATIVAVIRGQQAELAADEALRAQAETAEALEDVRAEKDRADANLVEANAQRAIADEKARIAAEKTEEAQRSAERADLAAKDALLQKGIAEQERAAALAARDKAETALAQALASQARSLTRLPGSGNEALMTAVRAAARDDRLRPMDTATAVLSEVLNTVRGPTFGDGAVATVAMVGDTVVTGSRDGQLVAWSPGAWDRGPHGQPAHRAAITVLAADGGTVASGDAGGQVQIWELDDSETGLRKLRAETVSGGVRQLLWGPDGLVVGADDGSITIVGPDTRRVIKVGSRPWRSLAVSPSGRIAAGGEDGVIHLIADDVTQRLEGHRGWVNGLDFAPAMRSGSAAGRPELASAGEDGTVRLWSDGEQRHVLRGHDAPIQDVAFDPRGLFIASASWDGTVRVWDSDSSQEYTSLAGHGDWVWSVAWTASGGLLLSAGEDGTARVWSWNDEEKDAYSIGTLSGHAGWVRQARFSPNEEHAITVGGDGHARLWTLARGSGDAVSHEHADLRRASGDGSVIASVSGVGTGRVWRAAGGQLAVQDLGIASAVAVGPGRTPYFGTTDGRVVRTQGTVAHTLTDSGRSGIPVTALAATERMVVAGNDSGDLVAWVDGQKQAPLDRHADEVFSLSVLGDHVLSVGRDRRVVRWQPTRGEAEELFRAGEPMTAELVAADRAVVGFASGAVEAWVRGRDGWARDDSTAAADLGAAVTDMTRSPDGGQLAVVSRDGAALVLDAITLAPMARYDEGEIVGALFGEDGGLVTVNRDGTVIRRPSGLHSYRELACSWLAQAAYPEAREPCTASP